MSPATAARLDRALALAGVGESGDQAQLIAKRDALLAVAADAGARA